MKSISSTFSKKIFIVKQEDTEADISYTYAFSDEKKADEFERRMRKAYEMFHTYSIEIIVDNPDDWKELEEAERDNV